MEFTHQHIPVTVGLYQNVTTDLPAQKRLVEEDPSNLIDKSVDYMMDLSLKNKTSVLQISTLSGRN